MRHILFFVLAAGLGGCALPHPATVRNYVPGELQTAAIGEPIFDVQTGVIRKGFVGLVTHDPRIPGNRGVIEQGKLYLATRNLGRATGGGYFLIVGNRQILINDSGVVRGVVGDGVIERVGVWPDTALFRPADQLASANGFRSQMIYSGMEGSTVIAVYREFAGDFMRPAFSQELRYDLNQSRTIGYRTIQIEVISATNSAMEYRVVTDGGLPWLPGY